MSYAFIGALVGLAFVVAEYFLFGIMIRRGAKRGEAGRGARILDMIRKAQIVIFPAVGWIVGSVFG
jgi:hypothetical protein